MRYFKEKVLFLLLGALSVTAVTAQAQNAIGCEDALTEAETSYFNGDFDRTIALLQPCLDSESYTDTQSVRAYALLGRTQFVLGDTEAARQAIEGLYTLAPDYEPDPQLPPNFSAFILEVKQQMIAVGSFPVQEPALTDPDQPELTDLPVDTTAGEDDNTAATKAPRKRKALFLGGGAALAVAAGAAILLSSGSGGGDTEPEPTGWPLPPTHPTGQ